MIHKDFQDLKLSALGMGCMRLPRNSGDDGDVNVAETQRMVDYAMAHGVNYYDTAWGYHNGNSETVIGQALRKYPRESYYLATKFPGYDLANMPKVREIFPKQLEKCGVDYFDFYLFHNVCEMNIDAYLDPKYGIYDYLMEQKKNGRIRHLGFSFHDSAKVLDRVLTEHPEVEFVQLQLNYLDWESPSVQSRLCYETAVRHGKKVVVMEPVKGGKLAAPSPEVAQLFRSYAPDASLPSWAIRFAASLDLVMVVLSGMSSLEQVEDNTGYMANFTPLTAEEQALTQRAAQLIRGDGTVPCTACSYCTEGCPQRIPIPTVLALYNGSILAPGEKDYRGEYRSLPVNAGACVYCGQCRRACPQHIDVISALKDAHAVLGED